MFYYTKWCMVQSVLAVTRAENQTGQVPLREPGMNTFSENGNDFVGRLLHEGGVSRRTFSAFPQTQTASTEGTPLIRHSSNKALL